MDVIMPQLGETVAEGTIRAWFKKLGDDVRDGDILFEVETDKATMEVQAVGGGRLSEIRVNEGDTAPVGTIVAVIGRDGEEELSTGISATPEADSSQELLMRSLDPYFEVETPARIGSAQAGNGLKVTPLARRLIAQAGLDVEEIAAAVAQSGRRRVMRDDVLAATAKPAAPAYSPAHTDKPAVQLLGSVGDYDVVPLNRVRRSAGEYLAKAWREIPHVVQGVEVNFQRVDQARVSANSTPQDREVRLTFLPFVARAVCLAIRDYPQVNANFAGDHLRVHRQVNLGIAVDLDHDGLVVPVINAADELTVAGLAKAIDAAIKRARSGKLSTGDLSGATYSISNSGTFGTFFTAPIINPPAVAILSIDGVRKRPVVIETLEGDSLGIAKTGVLTQSFDHRAFDGAYSAAFLRRLREIIETRDWSIEI